MEVYSIGFTQKTAEHFFGLLNRAGIRRLLDVRLNNVSQLAGFAKREDLRYFLREICGAEYVHEPLLAPTRLAVWISLKVIVCETPPVTCKEELDNTSFTPFTPEPGVMLNVLLLPAPLSVAFPDQPVSVKVFAAAAEAAFKVTEQVPVPDPHPAWAAVYQVWILGLALLSVTQS